MDQFAVVALRMVHHIHIPDAEIVVRDVDDLLIKVEGALVAGEVVLAGAVHIFQIDVRPAVHHPEIPLPQAVPQLRGAAVEHQHIRIGDLLHHQLAHVLGVDVEGGSLHKGHDLIQHPVGRQDVPVKAFHLPHTVVLDEYLLGFILLLPRLQLGALQVCFLLYGDNGHVVQGSGVVLLLALLAADQQGPVLAGEAVLQNAVDEIGFAGVQKAGDQINRNICHSRVDSLPLDYRPNSSASLSSFSSAPMTHRRPV